MINSDNRMNFIINDFNNELLRKDLTKLSLGFWDGKMGLCLYFSMQYKYTNNEFFLKKAHQMIEDVYDTLLTSNDVSVHNELPFIGIGLINLLETKVFEGNPNIILKEIDDKLFAKMSMGMIKYDSANFMWNLWTTIYFCKRIANKNLSQNDKELFSKLVIYSINDLNNHFTKILYSEPTTFSPFGYSLFMYLHLLILIYD